MRVGVDDLAAGEQCSGLSERLADVVGGLVDVLAGKQRDPGIEGAVITDGFGDFEAIGAAEVEIVFAVARGDVDEAGAGFGGDEVAQQQWRVLLVTATAQGVSHDGAGEVGALDGGQDGVGGDPGVLRDRGQQRFGDDEFLAGLGE